MRYVLLLIAFISSVLVHAQNDCPYDLNGDGFTGAGEIIIFLSEYGAPGNTDYDYNNNGIRDFEDGLIFSRHLGTYCPQPEMETDSGTILGLVVQSVDTLSEGLISFGDTIPSGAITYRLYAEVSHPDVVLTGVWGDAESPLRLEAPDGLFFSFLQGTNHFASNINPGFFPTAPTLANASWWTLNQDPEEGVGFLVQLGSTADYMDDINDSSMLFNAQMGDGWLLYENLPNAGLPTPSNLKLLGQFTTLGQGGICGQLNLEVRTLIDGQGEQFEQAFGLTFASPGSEDLCETATTCPEGTDVDEDGMVTVGDLLLVLGQFGGVTEGPADIDGDGTVTVGDILGVLSGFGAVCD